jgi:hypothetical protein
MRKLLCAIFCGLSLQDAATSLAVTPGSLITYVDATASNTTLADGSTWTPTTSRSGTDGLWCLRNFANPIGAGTIYETGGDLAPPGVDPNNEDAQRLKTTVTGLAPNTYNVYVYLWSDFSNWRIRAALQDNPTGELPLYVVGATLYGTPLPTVANPADFDGLAPLVTEDNRTMYQVLLGQVTGTSVSVYVDNDPGAGDPLFPRALYPDTFFARTWYDGIGIAAVPEPSGAILLVMAAPALLLAYWYSGRSSRWYPNDQAALSPSIT